MTRPTLIIADAVRTPSGLAGNAIRVEAGRVVAVGERAELGDGAWRVERYPGGIIVPGLRDAHLHLVAYTAALTGISLKTAANFADISARLGEAAALRHEGVPLVAIRLDDEGLDERRLPTRWDIDAAVPDRPALVHRYCGHIAVANSAALRIAGIGRDTADPAGGVIDRDHAGNPTGVLRETAIDPVSTKLAAAVLVTPSDVVDAAHRLAGLGITSIGAMTRLGTGPWATLGNEAEILIQAAPRLPITAHSYLIADEAADLERYSAAIRRTRGRLRWAGVKRFADGSLGGHTAAMHEPFTDQPATTGTLRLTERDRELAEASLRMGGGVAVHAIGDLAGSRVLDLFGALVAGGASGRLLRIEHASVLTNNDVDRMAALGVSASVQPAFLGSETGWLEKRVGPSRLGRTYPLASMERAGISLAGGSDSPVEPPDPWAGMALARDRAGIVPVEGLSARSAFRLFTSGAAVSLGEPEPLAAGSPADFVVVDRDPVLADPDELRATGVIDTWVAGARVEVDRSAPAWTE